MGNISFKEYSIFCIGKIWVDWPSMDLSIYPRLRFEPSEPGFCFGLIWRGLGVAWSPLFLWAWRVGYWAHFFIPISIYFMEVIYIKQDNFTTVACHNKMTLYEQSMILYNAK